MKPYEKFVLAAAASLLLAACGGQTSADGAASQPQAAASVPAVIDPQMQAVADAFPAPDPALKQPIEISDENRPGGRADWQKFGKLATGQTFADIMAAQQKVQEQITVAATVQTERKKEALAAAVKELGGQIAKLRGEADALAIKDSEISSVIDRMIGSIEYGYRVVQYSTDNMAALDKIEREPQFAALQKTLKSKTEKTETLSAGNAEILRQAMSKLAEKYGK